LARLGRLFGLTESVSGAVAPDKPEAPDARSAMVKDGKIPEKMARYDTAA